MKQLILVLFLLIGGLQITSAQSDAAAPSILLKERIHELGKVPVGMKHAHTFRFKNMGQSPLVIYRIEVGCGCLSSKFSQEPVAPGKDGEITVYYNSAGHHGNFYKTYHVSTNDPDNQSFDLAITGELALMNLPDKAQKPDNQPSK